MTVVRERLPPPSADHTLLVLLARMVAACLLWYLAPAAGFELSLLAACEPELWSWVSRCWG